MKSHKSMEINADHLHKEIMSDWAKKELVKARKEEESPYTDLEKL